MDITLSRRNALAAGLGLVFMPGEVWAQQDPELIPESIIPPLPTDLSSRADQSAYRGSFTTTAVGSAKPTETEIKLAAEILRGAPYSTKPLEVGNYFLEIAGASDDRAAFVREWPVRANPLIQTLFLATSTSPYGDITPWCAAFVNWCVARAKATRRDAGVSRDERFTAIELSSTSGSAASGSFRCWNVAQPPQPGDLAVFRQPNSNEACTGKGHVAFFLEKSANGDLRILGGNQLLRGTSGAVTVSRYPLSGGEGGRLRFLGYRTSSSLHQS